MPLPYTITTAPSVEPVSLAEQKLFMRVLIDDEDALISTCIAAARRWCEKYANRAYITQTIRVTAPRFPGSDGKLEIPLSPLQSVSSVQYYATDGTLTTLAASEYIAVTAGRPGFLRPAPTTSWPATQHGRDEGVIVTAVVGFGDASTDVPQTHLQAIKMLANHLFEERNPEVTGAIVSKINFAVESLLAADCVPEMA